MSLIRLRTLAVAGALVIAAGLSGCGDSADTTARGQVAEGVVLMDGVKASVRAYYLDTGRLPRSNEEIDLPEADTISGQYVKSVGVDPQGRIVATFSATAPHTAVPVIDGAKLLVTPLPNGPDSLKWQCGSKSLKQVHCPDNCTCTAE